MPLDANGTHQYTESDTEATFSDLLNLLAESTSTEVGDLDTRVTSILTTRDAAWTGFAPGLVNFGAGASAITARYKLNGKTVHVSLTVTVGSGFSMNTGLVAVTLPVTAAFVAGSALPVGQVSITDSGAGYYSSWARLETSTRVVLHDVYATRIPWTAGDQFGTTFTYEAA